MADTKQIISRVELCEPLCTSEEVALMVTRLGDTSDLKPEEIQTYRLIPKDDLRDILAMLK
jgi:hypothetical protein